MIKQTTRIVVIRSVGEDFVVEGRLDWKWEEGNAFKITQYVDADVTKYHYFPGSTIFRICVTVTTDRT